MNADQIIERIRELRPQLDALGVASLGLFGSVARGEERDDSDIDILVAYVGPATFDQYMDVKLLHEDALGRRDDLVTERRLRAHSRTSGGRRPLGGAWRPQDPRCHPMEPPHPR
jgi:predicted nucleotidyltransferase